jgi:hypothetical protein
MDTRSHMRLHLRMQRQIDVSRPRQNVHLYGCMPSETYVMSVGFVAGREIEKLSFDFQVRPRAMELLQP